MVGSEKPRKSSDPAIISVFEDEVRGTAVQVSATVSEDKGRGTAVQVSTSVSEDEVRGIMVSGTAGGADAVDVAESEEPRKLWAT